MSSFLNCERKSKISFKYELEKATHVIIFEVLPAAVTLTIFSSKKAKLGLNMRWKKLTYDFYKQKSKIRSIYMKMVYPTWSCDSHDFCEQKNNMRSKYELEKAHLLSRYNFQSFTWSPICNCHTQKIFERKSEIRSEHKLEKAHLWFLRTQKQN